MKAVPAFFRPKIDWANYMNAIPKKDFDELVDQAEIIVDLINKKEKYGDAKMRIV